MNRLLQATPLTLDDVAAHPRDFCCTAALSSGETITFRPLLPDDAPRLAEFLAGLSPQTRAFSTFPSYDLATAQEMCEVIARYQSYNYPLDAATDCRFGPTIADAYQNRGLGSLRLPHMMDLACRSGQHRLILWGGVMADNRRAIHYYQKHGFQIAGKFHNDANIACYDMIGRIP